MMTRVEPYMYPVYVPGYVCDLCGLSILEVSAGHVRDDPGRSWGGLVRPSAWASPQSPRLAGLSFPFVILGQ